MDHTKDRMKAKYYGYEGMRTNRYGNTPHEYHPDGLFLAAYNAWSKSVAHLRWDEWDTYCDVRDSYPIGTNAAIRLKNKQAARFEMNGYGRITTN